MTYTKPQLTGYLAIATIQATGQNAKTQGALEADKIQFTAPAYEADE